MTILGGNRFGQTEPSPDGKPSPEEQATEVDVAPPSLETLVSDRNTLVGACIEASDAANSDSLRKELLTALAASGVTAVEVPAGTPFDPSLHKAADTRFTEEEGLAGLVAETERRGFTDRGQRLRWPEVVVYQSESWRSRGS